MRGSARWILGLLLAVALGVGIGAELAARRDRVRVHELVVLAVDAGRPTVGSALAAEDSYVLRVRLDRAGYAVVAHLRGPGLAELLFPSGGLIAFPGAVLVQIPEQETGIAWRLPATHEPQAWLVAATRNPAVDLLDLEGRIRRAAQNSTSFEGDIAAVARVLDKAIGPSRSTILHPR